jgi:ankyrin repeat protein
MTAARGSANPETITALLNGGADINSKCNIGSTALTYAAFFNSNPGIITTLIKAGAEVNARYTGGATALMLAVLMSKKPDIAIAELLSCP